MTLVPRGLQYCGSFPAHEERPQLYHDPNNVTLTIVTSLLHEMSTLFPDQYFNVGADETFQYENQVSHKYLATMQSYVSEMVYVHARTNQKAFVPPAMAAACFRVKRDTSKLNFDVRGPSWQ